MIKANELRVGNWVSKQGEEYQCGAATILMLERNESEIEPIPITEDWLLRFGFEKKMLYPHIPTNGDFEIIKWIHADSNGGQYVVYFWYHSKFGELQCLTDAIGETISIAHDIKYVHQLQNLYFAITGEEI